MSPSNRERGFARRRYSDRQSRPAAGGAQLRRVTSIVLALIALAVVVTLVVLALRPTAAEVAASQPTPTRSPECREPADSAPVAPAPIASAPQPRPTPTITTNRTLTGTINTSCGPLSISLAGARAPAAVANFVALAESGFYDGTRCHRLTMSDFYLLQCGDPTQTGEGSPGYSFGPVENAPADEMYPRGAIVMARQVDDPGSHGSQFFIVYKDSRIPNDEAGGYSVFGTVNAGLDVVQRIADGGTSPGGESPARPISINGVEVT